MDTGCLDAAGESLAVVGAPWIKNRTEDVTLWFKNHNVGGHFAGKLDFS
jgi:hypothetical protein